MKSSSRAYCWLNNCNRQRKIPARRTTLRARLDDASSDRGVLEEGKPDELVHRVVTTQLETMQGVQMQGVQ
jgi:hypothetical protein